MGSVDYIILCYNLTCFTMSDTPIIKFTDVSKHFTLQHQRTLKEMVHALAKRQKTLEKILALNHVSFEVGKGESVGIIGRNGAGKSTLLKIIAGVTSPTMGKVEISEKVYPLIELGAGFHPDLTGRENVFLNGVILGMTEGQIEDQYNSIVEFAELEDFMDVPVKYYSSGMYMRLAFSVATAQTPSILLVDEILSVGDQKFQDKCLQRMYQFQSLGTSIILVAHSGSMIEKFCHRVLYLKAGKLAYDGPVKEGINVYANDI